MIAFFKRHYHWIIATVLLVELAVYNGILNNVSSIHLIPVTEDLGISRGSFSLVFSIRSLVGFFSTLFSGVFFLKFRHRWLASGALLLAAAAFILLGSSQGLFMLGLSSAIIGISEGFCSTAAASRLVNSWFHSHQGLILGLVSASTGLGGSLFSVVLSGIITRSSWRYSYWLSGLLFAIAAGLIFLLCRDRPADMKLRPFGEGGHHGKKARKESRDHWSGYSAAEIMRKPTFYLMILVVFFSCVSNYIAFTVVAPHLQDRGMEASQAAFYQSIMLLSLAAAKFICGTLSDYLGARAVNLFCMLCTVAGLVLLSQVNGPAMALAAVMVFSVSLVMTTITIPLLSNALFGYRAQGSVIGIFMALVPAASVVTNPIVNMLYDRVGSYSPIFLGGAVIATVVIVLTLLLFVLAARDRKKYEASHPSMPELEV